MKTGKSITGAMSTYTQRQTEKGAWQGLGGGGSGGHDTFNNYTVLSVDIQQIRGSFHNLDSRCVLCLAYIKDYTCRISEGTFGDVLGLQTYGSYSILMICGLLNYE